MRVKGAGFGVERLGLIVQGLGARGPDWSVGCRIQDLGFWNEGFELRVCPPRRIAYVHVSMF